MGTNEKKQFINTKHILSMKLFKINFVDKVIYMYYKYSRNFGRFQLYIEAKALYVHVYIYT